MTIVHSAGLRRLRSLTVAALLGWSQLNCDVHCLFGRTMRYLILLLAMSVHLGAQEPSFGRGARTDPAAALASAIAGAREDSAAFDRGGKLYAANCAGCHGASARGGAGAPDLVRSLVVLDDEKGILIAPVLRNGRPDQGMPKSNLSESQIADVVA